MVIDPEECIDCAVCVPECPVDAIVADTDIEPDDPWLHLNAELAKLPSFVEITEIDESKRLLMQPNGKTFLTRLIY